MAITDIKQYAHLTPKTSKHSRASSTPSGPTSRSPAASAMRATSAASIQLQRGLAAGGRAVLFASHNKIAWAPGTAMLAHRQDHREHGARAQHHPRAVGLDERSRDPLHRMGMGHHPPSVHWKKSHNFIHHKYTNVVGLDDDIGYGIMRLTRDQRWERWMIGNPVYNLLLGTLFEWGVAAHGLETRSTARARSPMAEVRKDLRIIGKKVGKQVGKDYIVFPALTGPQLEAHPAAPTRSPT